MKVKTLAVILAGLTLSTGALAVQPFIIQDIRIEGLQRTEPATVFSYLPVKVGDQFTDIKGEQIIKVLYATGFFDNIQVETQKNQVLLTVVERPVISNLSVEGGKTLSDTDIRKSLEKMGLAPSRVYDPVLMAHAIEGLKHEYTKRGKNHVQIEQKIDALDRNRIAIKLNIQEGQTTVIKNILFSGNEHYSDRTLRNQMSLSESGLFTWITKSNRFSVEKFSEDLKKINDFYQDRGYFDFQVVSTDVVANEENPDDLDVKIGVREGNRYRWGNITVQGDTKEIPLEELQALVRIKENSWYDHSKLVDILKSIQSRMGESGYALADIHVQPQTDAERQVVDFVLNITPGNKMYVNEIHILGNNKTRDEVIRREIRQMESAPYDGKKIKRSQERIELLGFFEDVETKPEPIAGVPDQMNLNVLVKEQPTGSLNVSAGYVQGDGLVLAAGVSQDNLFGTGKSANMRISNSSSSKVASLSYTDPYFTPDGVSLGYDVFWRTYDPNKVDVTSYKIRTYGAGVRMGVPITEYDRVNFGLGANNMKLSLFPQSPKRYRDFVKEYGDSNWTLSGNIGWGRNTTDSAIWPTRGYIISLNGDFGLPGGDLQYYKLMHNQQWFFPLNKTFTLTLSGQYGYANGYGKTKELPFFHNFYGGGLGSVRGYESSSLGAKIYDGFGNSDYMGGNHTASVSTELLFPFPGMKNQRSVRLSVFADAASVWDDKTYTVLESGGYYKANHRSSFKNELRYSTGLAFTWISPLGPMKFSYAYPIRDKEGDKLQRFQFQLGTVF